MENMIVLTPSKERTEEFYGDLLQAINKAKEYGFSIGQISAILGRCNIKISLASEVEMYKEFLDKFYSE